MDTNKTTDDLPLLDPSALHLRLEEHRLHWQDADGNWQPVSLAPLFPLSDAEHWVALVDAEGNEVGIVEDLRRLPHPALACAREALRARTLIPHIRRILSCRTRRDTNELSVETDRGPTTILLRDPQENVQQPLPGYYLLLDIQGNRFDIPDIQGLDADSRKYFDELI